MKRTIFVSVLVLALTVTLCGEAFSRSVPWSYNDPGTGDDHTWGGDFQAGPDGLGSFDATSGGWIPTNVIITTILFKWLGLNSIGDKTDADYFIQNQITETEPTEPANTNTGGNQ